MDEDISTVFSSMSASVWDIFMNLPNLPTVSTVKRMLIRPIRAMDGGDAAAEEEAVAVGVDDDEQLVSDVREAQHARVEHVMTARVMLTAAFILNSPPGVLVLRVSAARGLNGARSETEAHRRNAATCD
eukprot:6624908-Prymnesium_polylepis.3